MLISNNIIWSILNKISSPKLRVTAGNGSGLLFCKVICRGQGNSIVLGDNTVINRSTIQLYGNNCTLKIGSGCRIGEDSVLQLYDNGSTITIGDNFDCQKTLHISSLEGSSVTIGDNCLFSYDVDVRNSDAHSLFDEEMNRFNASRDVSIGNHVWVSERVTILKGTIIEEDCVVGAGAIVTGKHFQKLSLIVGTPAKVIRVIGKWRGWR